MLEVRGVFLNGVYESVLEEILQVQRELPNLPLFLQPYSAHCMAGLRDMKPSSDTPVHVYVSVTTALDEIRYEGQIIEWEDKRDLSADRRAVIERVMNAFQPNEKGLYDASPTGKPSVNLLHVRGLSRSSVPHSVSKLRKAKGGRPVSPRRKTAGGWAYIR
jgi:hypothetical protein